MKICKKKFLILFCAGALSNLAFAPFHFFLALLIALPLFYFFCNQSQTLKENFYLGWFYGFGYFVAGIYWIAISLLIDAASFAWLIPFAIILIPGVLALYFGLLAVSYHWMLRKFPDPKNYEKIVIFALCWTFCEILRAFLFTGFPWNLLGYSWMFSRPLIQIASIFGVWGLSFFAVIFSLLPLLFFKIERGKIVKNIPDFADKIFTTSALLLLFSGMIFGLCRIDDAKILNEKNIKLRLVQGNIKQEMKWDVSEKYRNFLKHIQMTNVQQSNDVAAVIWSETSVPYAIEAQDLINQLKLAVPQNMGDGGMLITGGLRLKYSANQDIENVWNSVFAVGNQGVIAHYDKHHLVPFGEYMPLQKYLPFVQKITDGAIGFSAGTGPKTIHGKFFSFSPLLCYEVIFPDKIIDRNDRPDLLVNLTNDAWFGNSSGPYQHFDMAAMRAVEYGIPLARVANTGITAFFDPFGRVKNKINLNQEGIIDVDLVKNLEPTIYAKYYFLPLFLLISSFVIFFITRRNVTRQNHTS